GQSRFGQARRFCASLLRGLRQTAEEISPAHREGACGASRSRRATRGAQGRTRRRSRAVRGLRGRQGARVRAATRLVQGALRGSLRPEPGAALRLLCGAFRLRRNGRADQKSARRKAGLSRVTRKTRVMAGLVPATYRG